MEGLYLSPFIQPSVEEYLSLLQTPSNTLRGGSLSDIIYYEPEARGAGLFSFLKRTILPLIKQPILKLGSRVLNDISDGVGIRDSLKSNAMSTVSEISQNVMKKRGGKRKKKRVLAKRRVKPRYKKDVFDDLMS